MSLGDYKDTNHFSDSNVQETYMRFEWSGTQNKTENYTTISWSIKAYRPNTQNWVYFHNTNWNIGGNTGSKGSTRYSNGETIASDSFIVYHNPSGEASFSFSMAANVYYSGGGYISASDSWTLDTIPRQADITSAPDFNDEQNPTIGYSNPAGNSVNSLQACISLTGASADVSYRDIPKTGSSYTFNLTEQERNVLRSATTKNSRNVTFYIKTIIGSSTFYSTLTKTFSIINGNPTFSNYVFEDIKPESLLLTGNNQYLINNYNTLQVTISSANKAIANKEATMSKYRLVCGNNSIEANYSNNSDVTLTLQNVTAMQFTVYAIDSRGNSTSITKSAAEWINYSPIAIATGNAVRTGGVGTETTLSFQGTIWKTEEQYDFGAVANEITLCQYQFKKSNESTYSEPINITPTVNNNNFSFNSTIRGDEGTSGAEGFNLSNAYDIKITIADKISTYSYDVLLGSGKPQMAIAPRRCFIWRTI